MFMDNAFPKRKPIRLKNYNYDSPDSYFITICTENRRNLFWDRELNADIFHWLTVGANSIRYKKQPTLTGRLFLL